MKLLLDHNIPRELKDALDAFHVVATCVTMGWEDLSNGKLLAAAAHNAFEVFVSVDKKIEYEQNLKRLPLPVVILDANSNRWADVTPFVEPLLAPLARTLDPALYVIDPSGEVVTVSTPRAKTKRGGAGQS